MAKQTIVKNRSTSKKATTKKSSNTTDKKNSGRLSKVDAERIKREAYKYYVEHGLEQKEISAITKVSENTISKWKKDGEWDKDKELTNFEPKKLMLRVTKQYTRLLDIIDSRDAPEDVATTKEADILSKLSDSVKKLQNEILFGHKTEVGKLFVSYLMRVYDKETAVQIMDLWHEFIMNSDK